MTVIRSATPEDAERLAAIYAYYVEKTAISFEYAAPTATEFMERIEKTLARYPYLVAVEDGAIVGYAYAGVFKARAAYDHCVELTVYLDRNAQKRGLGRKLYEALEAELQKRGFRNLYACIGYPVEEDEYLTRNSADFHAHLGFTEVGRFHRCGYKFGRWYDMIWMEKCL